MPFDSVLLLLGGLRGLQGYCPRQFSHLSFSVLLFLLCGMNGRPHKVKRGGGTAVLISWHSPYFPVPMTLFLQFSLFCPSVTLFMLAQWTSFYLRPTIGLFLPGFQDSKSLPGSRNGVQKQTELRKKGRREEEEEGGKEKEREDPSRFILSTHGIVFWNLCFEAYFTSFA